MNSNNLRIWLPAIIGFFLFLLIAFYVIDFFFGSSRAIALTAILILSGFFLLFVLSALRVITEYERVVVFRLGKSVGTRGPGVIFVLPFLERAVILDTREKTHEVAHEKCITKDNAQIDVDFIFVKKIVNPEWSQTRVQNLDESLEQLATGLLRAVIGGFQLDEALAQRDRINEEFKEKLEGVSEHWGVTVTTVEIREIITPKDVQDAMHRQLAAERDRRAEILKAQGQRERDILRAEGEAIALERLYNAARQIDPKTLQIEYFKALTEVGRSSSTKYVLPLEMTQFLKPFLQGQGGNSSTADSAGIIGGEELTERIKKVIRELATQSRANNDDPK